MKSGLEWWSMIGLRLRNSLVMPIVLASAASLVAACDRLAPNWTPEPERTEVLALSAVETDRWYSVLKTAATRAIHDPETEDCAVRPVRHETVTRSDREETMSILSGPPQYAWRLAVWSPWFDEVVWFYYDDLDWEGAVTFVIRIRNGKCVSYSMQKLLV